MLAVLACWATCSMEIPPSSDIPSCSCDSVTLTFRSSCLPSISVYPWPSHRKRHAAFTCLPQRPTGFLRPWMKASFAAASAFSRSSLGTEELSPSPLGTSYHASHVANFLALLPSFPNSPTIVLCLPRSGPLSAVSKIWKISLPSLVEYFRMYLRKTSSFSGSIKRTKASMSTLVLTHFSRYFPLPHDLSFQRAPSNSLFFQTLLPLSFT